MCDVMWCGVVCVMMLLIGICKVNTIGDIGAQSIGDGLKSPKSLTTLNLNGEWCVPPSVWCVWLFVCWMSSEQHWRHWSTMHWWWSQVTHISYNTEFGWWVICDLYHIIVRFVLNICEFEGNNIGVIGAQSIGDGLKQLKSLTTLDLSS